MKNSRLSQGLPVSIKERVILAFREEFISRNFTYAKFRENKVLAKFSEFTVIDFRDFIWVFAVSETILSFKYSLLIS